MAMPSSIPDRPAPARRFSVCTADLYEAIEQRDGELAAYLARSSLLDVYGPLLPAADHKRLQLLVREANPPGGRQQRRSS